MDELRSRGGNAKTIAQRLGVSPRTVTRARARLRELEPASEPEPTPEAGSPSFVDDPRLEPAPALFSALLATLPPREDRDPEAPLFPGLTDAALRTAISRACKTAGVPHFSPHALRRRRGCLHYKRTGSLAEVALGDTKNVAAEHYIYALTDYREIDPQPELARLFT